MECHEPSVRQAFLSYLIFIDIYFQIIEQSTLVVCDFNKLSKKCVFGGWMNGLNGCVCVLRHHQSPHWQRQRQQTNATNVYLVPLSAIKWLGALERKFDKRNLIFAK